MATLPIILYVILLLVWTDIPLASAEVYKWVDEKGTVHFTQDPSTIPEKYRDKVKTRVMEEEPVQPYRKPDSGRGFTSSPRTPISTERPRKVDEASTAPPSPGFIPFDKFKHLKEGMTEAEVLSRFGNPTRIEQDEVQTRGSIEGGTVSGHVSPGGSLSGTVSGGTIRTETVVIKRYYYIGDHSKGEKTTIIHIKKGKVFKYQRI